MLEEENLTEETLKKAIASVWENRETYRKAMAESQKSDAIEIITGLIEKLRKR